MKTYTVMCDNQIMAVEISLQTAKEKAWDIKGKHLTSKVCIVTETIKTNWL